MRLTDALIFLPEPPASSVLYVGIYDPKLVVLSILIAVFAARAALEVASRLSHAQSLEAHLGWRALGALAMGGGIWAMHFIGMLALQLPCSTRYETDLTLWSIAPGVLASAVAIEIIRRNRPTQTQIALGSLLLGAGIGAMHYSGMAAMRIDGLVRYDPKLFALSIVVAVVLAFIALQIRFRLNHGQRWRMGWSAIVMGCAVSSMHYTAMAATYFLREGDVEIPASALEPSLMATLAAIVTGLLIALVLVATVAARYQETAQQLAESEYRIRRILETTQEGFAQVDMDRHLVFVNPAYCTISGRTAKEMIGRPITDFFTAGSAQTFLQEMRKRDEGLSSCYEIELVRPDGNPCYCRFNGSPIFDRDGILVGSFALVADITHIKRSAAELERLAHYDPLTGLANRLLLDAQLRIALGRVERHGDRLGVLELDLDGFKNVNDSFGHPAGDALLQVIGTRLREVLRGEDLIARLGGDEFAVVLESLGSIDHAALVAEKIIAACAEPVELDGKQASVTCSIGIALFPEDGADSTALLKAADTALYVSKREGRNTYRFYNREMTAAVLKRHELEQGLRLAIERGELELWYQPQVALREHRVIGVEALVRWRHPQRGLVAPLDFLPVASETGLIVPLGEWVLRTACQQMQDWRQAGLKLGHVAVNVDGQQIVRSDFVGAVERVLAETGLPARYLQLEITESFLLENAENGMGTVMRFAEMGVEVEIDDFGTGYSSLSYLKYLHADGLKIDRSFISDLPEDATSAAIIRAVVSLARGLGFHLVAEGVEKREQLDYLRSIQCDRVQGYYFSRPLPAAELADWLADPALPARL